jgi:hypothetical protein
MAPLATPAEAYVKKHESGFDTLRTRTYEFTVAINDADTFTVPDLSEVVVAFFCPTSATPGDVSIQKAGTGNRDLTFQLGASLTGTLVVMGY